jgi:GDSL-like Lipase/Acylhydrolase family
VTKRFERYVAVGDSTSEGLDDPDGRGGYRGWANRLAERIARQQGSLLYANLAVRGRVTRQIREEQLAPALAMKPDLATVVAGTNDALRRKFDAAGFSADLGAMQSALIQQGATVLTFTLPDLAPVMPFAKVLGKRVFELRDPVRPGRVSGGIRPAALVRRPPARELDRPRPDRRSAGLPPRTAGHRPHLDGPAARAPGADGDGHGSRRAGVGAAAPAAVDLAAHAGQVVGGWAGGEEAGVDAGLGC